MPVEILTASQRAEWERFPEEIDEASLGAFFSFADDELELIAGHRDIHGRFATAVSVGALRWLGFVPAALEELPEPAAALIASQLDIALSSIQPARLNAARDVRAEHIAQSVMISAAGMSGAGRDRRATEITSANAPIRSDRFPKARRCEEELLGQLTILLDDALRAVCELPERRGRP